MKDGYEPLTQSRKRPCNVCPLAPEVGPARVKALCEGGPVTAELLCLQSGCLSGTGTQDHRCRGFDDNVERLIGEGRLG